MLTTAVAWLFHTMVSSYTICSTQYNRLSQQQLSFLSLFF